MVKRLAILCALLASTSTAQAQAARRVDQPADSHCLAAVVYSKPVDFFRLSANQKYTEAKLEVKREPTGGTILGVPVKARCLYEIGLFGDSPLGGWLPLWSKLLNGPGMLFSDGVWHLQSEDAAISLDEINILPTPYKQLLIQYKTAGRQGTHTRIGVYYFNNGIAFSDSLVLSVSGSGDLTYTIHDQDISITGCWQTCTRTGTVVLRFDKSVSQFAIVNPTQESEQFYKYVLRSDFNP